MGYPTEGAMMVRMLVNRLHVSTSDRDVIRYVRSRLSDEGRAPANREARRGFYREALDVHRENQREYAYWRF